MAPQIQYAKTSDGVSIAYWTLGEGGTALVLQSPFVFSHIGLEWENDEVQSWYRHLAEQRTIVRYDRRNNGLSERRVGDVALAALVGDLQAVVDRLGLERFALMAFGGDAPIALGYAAEFPSRLWRLLISNGVARLGEIFERPEFQQVMPLAETDWRLFTETLAHVTLGWRGGRAAHDWARFIRRSVTQEDYMRMLTEDSDLDVSGQLFRVETPTLILQQRIFPLELGQKLASGIPNARLLQHARGPFLDAGVIQAIDEFLAEDGEPARREGDALSGTAVILFADIADSTALTERLGDAAFRETARELDEALRKAIASNGGTAIEGKLLGDGVLAVFGAAREAIACARALHAAGSHAGLPLHIGIHAGDVIREEGNVYGGAVNIAARVAGEAATGETLVSGTVRDLARTSAGVTFEDRGERALKGVSEPVRVWGVKEQVA